VGQGLRVLHSFSDETNTNDKASILGE